MEKIVIGVAGMPGAGKSTVVDIAKESGYSIVVMGDEVRREAESRGLEPTPENLGALMFELRRLEGEVAVARRCMPKIKAGGRKVIVDGIRSLSEVEEFKGHFPNFLLLAVHASPETRFKRLYRRSRSDDPKNWGVFRERDLRELEVGLGDVIAMADYMVVNEGGLEALREKVKEVLMEIERRWMK